MSGQRLLLVVVSLVSALLLDMSVLARIDVLGVRPSLLFVVVACFALTDGPAVGMTAGFAAGLTVDAMSSHTLGVLALVYCIVGYAAGMVRAYFDRMATVTPILVVAGLSAVATLGYVGLAALVGDPRVSAGPIARSVLLASLYDGALTPFVYPAVSSLARRTDQSARRL